MRQLHSSTRHTFLQTVGDAVRAGASITFGVFLILTSVFFLSSVTYATGGANLLNAVTDFGADPTGTKDSTKQLQALFDQLPNGWQGFVPIGTYLVSNGLTIRRKTGIRIVGAAGGSFGSPVLSWTGGAGGTVITLEGTSYSSLEHLFILESNNALSGSGRIGICVDTDTSPSSHDRFEDIQCRAPSIAGFRFGGTSAQDGGHHVFITDNILCDNEGGDAFQFLNSATVFNRIVSGETSECDRSLEIEGGSVSVVGLDFEYDTTASIHVGNANAPITLYSSQIESNVSILTVDGPANAPLPILIKNWRMAVASAPLFGFENQSLGPLTLESNLLQTADSSAPYIVGTGAAFASGSTLISLANYYTLDPLSSLNTPYGPGPERVISFGDVGVNDGPAAGPVTLELPTIIEGPRL